MDRKADIDTITTDRYWYYKSTAKMGFWNHPGNRYQADVDIWVETKKIRFDFRVNGDTLIERDKMGDQGKYIKIKEEF
jgi:hypothetical protein